MVGDVLSRIVFGARVSLQVGALCVVVSTIVAMTLGVSAAYLRGPWDYVVGRLVDVCQALPAIVTLIPWFTSHIKACFALIGLLQGIQIPPDASCLSCPRCPRLVSSMSPVHTRGGRET